MMRSTRLKTAASTEALNKLVSGGIVVATVLLCMQCVVDLGGVLRIGGFSGALLTLVAKESIANVLAGACVQGNGRWPAMLCTSTLFTGPTRLRLSSIAPPPASGAQLFATKPFVVGEEIVLNYGGVVVDGHVLDGATLGALAVEKARADMRNLAPLPPSHHPLLCRPSPPSRIFVQWAGFEQKSERTTASASLSQTRPLSARSCGMSAERAASGGC